MSHVTLNNERRFFNVWTRPHPAFLLKTTEHLCAKNPRETLKLPFVPSETRLAPKGAESVKQADTKLPLSAFCVNKRR